MSELTSIQQVVSIVWIFLSAKTVTSIANAMNQAAFPLVLKNVYHMREASMGVTMSALSAFNALVNGVLLGPIIHYFANGSTMKLIGYTILFMSAVSFIQAAVSVRWSYLFTGGLYIYLSLAFVLSMAQYLLATSITSEATSKLGQVHGKGEGEGKGKGEGKGTLLGLEHSLFAAARVFAPQAGVWLLQGYGVPGVSGACAGIFLAVYVAWQILAGRNSTAVCRGKDEDSYSDDETDEKNRKRNCTSGLCFPFSFPFSFCYKCCGCG